MADRYSWLMDCYRRWVTQAHPEHVRIWPVLSGSNAKIGALLGWEVWAFTHTAVSGLVETSGVGDLPSAAFGFQTINEANREQVRARLEKHFRLGKDDCIFLLQPAEDGGVIISNRELDSALRKHEAAMGIGAMRIFLSHKGADKTMVRDFDKTLRILGFDTWLDEDAMPAGSNLERSISKGFEESCAAIFFVTKNYEDKGYLATEVDYAIREKRAKGERFQIITITFDGVSKTSVPTLIQPYVWKTPSSQLEALQEIFKALPLKVGDVYWRN